MKQWMMIGAVVAVIAALLLVATGFGQTTNPFEDENIGDCTCRVYIEDANGALLYADVPLSSLTFSEAMMLSFGQGVREVAFKPLTSFTSTTSQLAYSSNYKLYSDVSFKVTGGASTSSVTASWMGVAGLSGQSSSAAPNHETSANILMTPNGQQVVSWTKSGIVAGTSYSMSQNGAVDGDNDKWSKYMPMPSGAPLTKLTGDTIDGAKLTVTLTVKSGSETQSATADLLIKVNSWGSTASSSSLTITITGMSGKAG